MREKIHDLLWGLAAALILLMFGFVGAADRGDIGFGVGVLRAWLCLGGAAGCVWLENRLC